VSMWSGPAAATNFSVPPRTGADPEDPPPDELLHAASPAAVRPATAIAAIRRERRLMSGLL
jgi:hypothetical protein